LGFSAYIEPVRASYEDHKLTSKERDKKHASRLDTLGLSEDQLLEAQQALFEQARQKFLAATQVALPDSPSSSPTPTPSSTPSPPSVLTQARMEDSLGGP